MTSTMTSNCTFVPHPSSPLARTASPFKHPRTPPCTPRNTAKLWDEYEKRAVENARRRETTFSNTLLRAPESQLLSSGTVLDIIRSSDPHPSPRIPAPSPNPSATASPQFDFGFQMAPQQTRHSDPTSSTTVAICKICKKSILPTSGICERCKKTIILPSQSGESTPPLSPSRRNFGSTNLSKLHKESTSGNTTPKFSSPKCRSAHPSLSHLSELPIRLSSLLPPPTTATTTATMTTDTTISALRPQRECKPSMADPHEPFLRLQIARKPIPGPPATVIPIPPSGMLPSSPTTPPSSSHSKSSHSHPQTRPPSLANITTPPQYATYSYSYSRHASATPSELSTLYPYISNSNSASTTITTPSVCRASYTLQNTMSAWDWDSDDDEEEKAGLVGYWRAKKWRGSRGSLADRSGSGGGGLRERERSDSSAKEDGKAEGKKKKRGFVRVISCGCGDRE
ncbi:uncharacterized protein BDR25DRAFT_66958 [Lindgomyces ingoldianus]|uniref:Uncharacterized protein n=1 Tax=Lindgomyces ingoldianus TaxID=673940 RepID=A0ACB6RCP5_9PLEO|nr:uncharacterized protein BDR25DRAFT_66958 [Lindgomyces ingoldianus]KAF2476528.1 hypothetical protein BDR25DRAFT_66958 [Lindgomyces ingoldianus]